MSAKRQPVRRNHICAGLYQCIISDIGAQERTPKPFSFNTLAYQDSIYVVNSNENAAADGPRNGVESANEAGQLRYIGTKSREFAASKNLGRLSKNGQVPLALAGMVMVVRNAPQSVQGAML